MGFYLSPLVDVIERDVSSTIQAVSTTIGVNVIRNPKIGPEMKVTQITSEDRLINTFGEPTNEKSNYIDILSSVGALQNMNSLYCTGIRPFDSTFAGTISRMSTVKLSASDTFSLEFDGFEQEGLNSLKLSDLASQDPDNYHNEVFPDGPIDIIHYCRGQAGNRVRFAIINYELFHDIVKKGIRENQFAWNQVLLSIDTILETKNDFIILIQKLPNESEDKERNWKLIEFFNVSTVERALDDNGRTKFAENIINSNSSFLRIALNETIKNKEWNYATPNWVGLTGGFNGTPEKLTVESIMEAYNLYLNPEEIDINLIIDSDKPVQVKKHIETICNTRRDCFGILDCEYESVVNNKGAESQSLTAWRNGLAPYIEETENLNISSDKVAVYGNWLEVYDRWNKKYRWIPASGYVASVYSFSDTSSEPWFAPAGLNRAKLGGSIRRLAFSPTLGERDLLYKNGINPITSFAGEGKVIWGQKTMLDSGSSFNRVNIRRLFIVLEKSISTYVKYYLFEPNDEFTRHQIVSAIEPFLRDVKARRGIYEFEIICDLRNNTPARIDRNELWIDILVKPTITAEFIVLRFTNTSTGATFSELTGSLES